MESIAPHPQTEVVARGTASPNLKKLDKLARIYSSPHVTSFEKETAKKLWFVLLKKTVRKNL